MYIIVTALIPAIFEELFFRKGIINISKKYGEIFAILISAVIFGKFTPHGAMLACMLFGLCSGVKVLAGTSNIISPNLISMIPYIVTILALVLFVGKARVPAANGKPYIKSK